MRSARPSLACLLCGVASVSFAQVSPNGAELQVNSYTTGSQTTGAVAADAQGNFVVVWTSIGTVPGGSSIKAQRYAANGAALGGEFQVNTYTTGYQYPGAVAADAQGNFVVVWTSAGSGGNDTSGASIQARRYAANGTPLDAQFQVNTYTTNSQVGGQVAVDVLGNFVVVWASNGSSGTDADNSSVQAQRYAANGAPLGGQFQVNTYTTNYQTGASVASNAQGNFVVVWSSVGSSGTDTDFSSVQGQRYAANGTPLGGQFQANTYTTSYQTIATVASNALGDFIVAWDSDGSSGTDTFGYSVQAQRYAANGTPLGVEFQVNSYTTDHQQGSWAAADAAGNFVVTWMSEGANGTDTDYQSIQAQRYAANGAPLGGQFQVNTYTTSYQEWPVVAADARGNFVVAWQSYGSDGTDTDSWSIHAQRFDELFRDGFAEGDSARWSLTVF